MGVEMCGGAQEVSHLFCFFKDFIYLFLDRREGREKEKERNINVWFASCVPPTGDLVCNPGMCPD